MHEWEDRTNTTTPLEVLINDWYDARATVEKYTQLAGEIAGLIMEQVEVGEKATVPGTGIGVQVSGPRRTFRPAKAIHLLTPEQLAAISELTPLSSKARNLLPPALYDQLCDYVGEPYLRAYRSKG